MSTRGGNTSAPAQRFVETREHRSWYWYDWANSAYVTTTATVLFAPYLTAVATSAVCPDPVSYTHLDVYKRQVCAPHHRHFASGVSDIFHVDQTAVGNPQAMVDIIRGAFQVGMRDFTFNPDENEFIRITGYRVRKSDLGGIDEYGARHGSDYLAAGAERTFHLTERAVKRIRAHELDPRGAV